MSVPALDLLAVYDPPRATLGPPTGSVAVGAQDPRPEMRLPDGPPPTAAAPVPQGPPEPIPENGGEFPDDVYDLLRPCLNLGGGSWGVDVHKTEVEFCILQFFMFLHVLHRHRCVCCTLLSAVVDCVWCCIIASFKAQQSLVCVVGGVKNGEPQNKQNKVVRAKKNVSLLLLGELVGGMLPTQESISPFLHLPSPPFGTSFHTGHRQHLALFFCPGPTPGCEKDVAPKTANVTCGHERCAVFLLLLLLLLLFLDNGAFYAISE